MGGAGFLGAVAGCGGRGALTGAALAGFLFAGAFALAFCARRSAAWRCMARVALRTLARRTSRVHSGEHVRRARKLVVDSPSRRRNVAPHWMHFFGPRSRRRRPVAFTGRSRFARLIRRPLQAWLHVRRFMKWWSCSRSCRWKGWPQTTHWRGGGTVRGLARRLARRFSSERQAAPHVFRWRYLAVGSVAPRVNVSPQMVQVFGGRMRRRGGMASGSPASRARRRRRRG